MEPQYTGTKRWDNGRTETYACDDWVELCQWLARNPEAGISAYDTRRQEAVDQAALQEDVAHYA
jgi:hypothetical protein